MAPLVLGEFHQHVFEETDTEIVYASVRADSDPLEERFDLS